MTTDPNMLLPSYVAMAGLALESAKDGIRELQEEGYLTESEAERFIEAEREFYHDLAEEELEEIMETYE